MLNLNHDKRILIVDDEKPIREVLHASLTDESYVVESAENGFEGLEKMATFQPHIVLLDIWMPGDLDGIAVLKKAKEHFPEINFIMMSGHGTIETAVQATKLGAWDFIEKPLSFDKISILIKNILSFQKIQAEKKNLLHKLRENIAIVGSSEESKRIKQLIVKVAPTAHWILVEGDIGTGKELIANNIHYLSPRAGYSFVRLKCGQVPADLMEGELFGYEQGSLIGSQEERVGKLDLAHNGTLFLADIDTLSMVQQEKLYRFLQDGKIQRSGGTKHIELDVRVVAATTKDLAEEVRAGRFHKDLYTRLTLVPFTVTPLRQRPEDIESLVHYFSAKVASSGGFTLKVFTQQAMQLLLDYGWTGNVRELKNFIERVYILTPVDEVDVDDVRFAGLRAGDSNSGAFTEVGSFREARAQFEKEYISSKINEFNGNISKTAEAIGLERSYLHRKIKAFDIEIEP